MFKSLTPRTCDLKLVVILTGSKWGHFSKKGLKVLYYKDCVTIVQKVWKVERQNHLLSHHPQNTFILISIEHARPIGKQWGYIRKQTSYDPCPLGADGPAKKIQNGKIGLCA